MQVVNDKRLNGLSGKSWLQYSFSIWRDIRKTTEELKLKHPAIFPTALTSRLIEIFTKEGDAVLDPFMGCGSTMVSASQLNRRSCGIELSPEFFEIANKRILDCPSLADSGIPPKIYKDDSRNLHKYVEKNSISLCLTSPPYWDILNRRRTADYKEIRNYSDSDSDVGNIKGYDAYLTELSGIFQGVHEVLADNGYCVIVVMDIRKKSKFYPLHMNLIDNLSNIGFNLEDIIIWDRQHEYNNMRPLGYPYKFRVNKVHEYILIFTKES